MSRGLALLFLLPLAVLWSGDAGARIYKWVDEQGAVHYSDSVSPEEADERRRREIKSDSGRTVEVLEPSPTHEEIEARAAAEAERRRAADAAARRAEQDRLLLKAFANVEDIEAARDDRLQAVEGQIDLVRARIDKLQMRLTALRADAARMERSGRGDPAPVYAEIAAVRQRIAGHRIYINGQRAEQERIRGEFARDIRRFRELAAERGRPLAAD